MADQSCHHRRRKRGIGLEEIVALLLALALAALNIGIFWLIVIWWLPLQNS
jgi:hypothetical protein